MIIVFDIGGTKMRLAVSRDGQSIDAMEKIETPQGFEEGMDAFSDLAHKLAGGEKIDAVAGGIAGSFDKSEGCLLYSPHLIQWSNHKIVSELQKRLNTDHVYFQNDAALVGLGEAHVGAGKGHSIVAYLTVSTGVGGARLVNGRIDQSSSGFEPGHSIIQAEDVVTGGVPPIPGTIETYISGTSLEEATGIAPWETVEPEYKELWDKLERYLGYLVHNVSVFWSPDAIVLGGSMVVKKTYFDIDSIQERLNASLTIFQKNPKILKATLADDGGLEGARVFANQMLSQ